MSTIDGNTSGNGESPKGSIDNPYTQEEFNSMCDAGTWMGGYVEGMDYVFGNTNVTASWSGSDFDSDFWDSFPWDDPFEPLPDPWEPEPDPLLPSSPEESTPNNENGNQPSNEENGDQGGTVSGGSSDTHFGIPPRYVREAAFLAKYPTIAIAIGIGTDVYPNISSIVIQLTNNLGLPQKFVHHNASTGVADATNAMRHTLWQAVIAARYGSNIAKEAGDAHEDNPYVSLNAVEFKGNLAFQDADQTIDLLNNRIGRLLGSNSNSTDILVLAYIVLEEFYLHGLYTANRLENNHYEIIKEKLSEEAYHAALNILSTLNE